MIEEVRAIVARALDGDEVTPAEALRLFTVPLFSEEACLIQYAARRMSAVASGGMAEVHAQVGINTGPCPKNCAFCSFAAGNGIFRRSNQLSLEDVIERCLAFEADGANAIYLMTTAAFDFQELLRMGKEVRAALRPETVLVANTPDFDEDGAAALKRAGFTGIYHAVRLGEGLVTGIRPERRLRTIQAAKHAGLLVGTCVEPVGPEHSPEELVEKTVLGRAMAPVYSGAARRIPVPGTALAARGRVSEAQMAHILAVVRLVMGYGVPGNCTHEPGGIGALAGANLLWAEKGSNPRDVDELTENSRGCSVARCREILGEAGWEVLDGPSRMFQH